jgi:hypothetical protein
MARSSLAYSHDFPSMEPNRWWLRPKVTGGKHLDLSLNDYSIAFIDRRLALYVIATT